MVLIELLLFFVIAAVCFYKWATAKYDFFEKRNIPYEKPFILVGNFKEIFLRRQTIYSIMTSLHQKFNSKIYGMFEMRNPVTIIKDQELIKQITIKDFEYFTNHRTLLEPEDDALLGNSLVTLKNQKWKDMRSTLSPSFTGSKMRLMFELISECCQDALNYLKNEESKIGSKEIDLNMKEFFTRYTADVIASTAFGLKINSLSDENNDFFKKAQQVTKFSIWTTIKVYLFMYMKPVMKYLNIKILDKKFSKYFTNIVKNAIKYRIEHKIVRPDMINLLIEAKKSVNEIKDGNDVITSRKWTDDEMIAQCFLFFFAGFETTALSMCFAAQELMANEACQEKLYKEIEEVKTTLDGKPLTYEILQNMKYLDMIVSETLRKWPPAVATDRVCNKNYTLEIDGVPYEIKKGESIWINIVGVHYDPDIHSDPTKFVPERFSDENKGNITPFTYAPFGFGPRICIASRLALMEAKSILFHIMSEFKLMPSDKSIIPIEIDPKATQIQPKGGFQLKLSRRRTEVKLNES